MNPEPMAKYTGLAQLLHWLIAIFIVTQFALVWSAEALPRGETRSLLMTLHKSVGMTVLMLAIVRVAWRFLHAPPAFPATMTAMETALARATHWGLYVLIFLMPLSGWLLTTTAGRPVEWFWMFAFPDLMAEDRALHETFESAHVIMSWMLLALAALHVFAVLWHLQVKKDNLIRRMLP